jgi:hypothetical protein
LLDVLNSLHLSVAGGWLNCLARVNTHLAVAIPIDFIGYV